MFTLGATASDLRTITVDYELERSKSKIREVITSGNAVSGPSGQLPPFLSNDTEVHTYSMYNIM